MYIDYTMIAKFIEWWWWLMISFVAFIGFVKFIRKSFGI